MDHSKRARRDNETQTPMCAVRDCKSRDTKARRHTLAKHLPSAFAKCNANLSEQIDALQWLSVASCGSVTLEDVVKRINSSQSLPPGITLDECHDDAFRKACQLMGIPAPAVFTLYPVNSPAVLLFWRCLVVMLNWCSEKKRHEFFHLGAASRSWEEDNDERTCDYPLDDLVVIDEIGESDEQMPTPHFVPFIDSHFHLDRTSHKIWGQYHGHTAEDIIKYSNSKAVKHPPTIPVNVVGGVAVYSEPQNYPSIPDEEGPWKLAVGVHPKHIDSFTVGRTIALQHLLENPQVVALGEFGLDRTVPASNWVKQEEVFCRLLRMAKEDRPIVLHLRGIQDDRYNSDVYARGLMLARSILSAQQKIHLHGFTGLADVVKSWLQDFPQTYFGVTAAVRDFDRLQLEALNTIPRDRLVLETDAPYFPIPRADISTPAYIGDTAAEVAVYLEVTLQELSRITIGNTKELYGL